MKYFNNNSKIKRNYNMVKKHENEEKNHSFKKLKIPKLEYFNKLTEKEIKYNIEIKASIDLFNRNSYINLDIYTINIYIQKLNELKIIIPSNYFDIIDINRDGNCFLRATSKFLFNSEKYYKEIRKILYDYILENKDKYVENNLIEDNNVIIEFDEYINKIKKDGNFCGELKISAINEIFNIAIYVFEKTNDNKGYRLLYKIINYTILMQHTLILNHCYLDQTKIEDFDLFVINNNFDIEFLNNKGVNNHINNDDNNLENNEINEKKSVITIKNKNNIKLNEKINVEKKQDLNFDLLLNENYLEKEQSINNSNTFDENLNHNSSKLVEEDNKVKSEISKDNNMKDIIKNKNVLYNICATIINSNLNGLYSILIEKDYDIYKLYKNDICVVKSNMIKKVEYKVWLKILNN